jgi:membrane protein DedA with SNARE-associated domain
MDIDTPTPPIAEPRRFRITAFLAAYALFALLLCGFGFPTTDISGAGLILTGVVLPLPFFLAGYFAHRMSMSVVYALLVAIAGVAFSLLLIPYFGRLFFPPWLQ